MDYPHFRVKRPKKGLIGHRGVAALAPENTLASFSLAAALGIDWIEFDVRLTKDDSLIIFHDDYLERTTNGSGLVEQQTAQSLALLDAGSWFAPQFSGEKIPFFSQIVAQLLDLDLYLNIELKTAADASDAHVARFAQQFCLALKNLWPKSRNLPLISSFQWPLLLLIHQQFPAAPLGFLSEQCTQKDIDHTAHFPNSALHCDYQSLTPALIAYAHQFQVPLLAYTVNSAQVAHELLQAGLFALFSDDPFKLSI